MMPVASYPRIVRFIGTTESDTCPHCGARGRYVVRAQIEDGRTIGAMRGCIQLFPTSEIAREEMRLRDKAADRAKRGWVLSAADSAALVAIEAFYRGEGSEQRALSAVRSARLVARARMARR